MKQCYGDGAIRQRPDKLWEKRFYVTNPSTGVSERFSVYGRTKTEVIRKAKEKEIEVLMRSKDDSPSSYTLEEWLNTWLSEFALNIKEATFCKYEQVIRCHLVPALGDIRLNRLTVVAVQRFYNGKVREGLSAKTIHDIHGVLHKALEHARRLEYVQKNVTDDCELPSVHRKEMHPIVDDKLKEFLLALEDSPYRDIIYVTVFTGMRKSEAIGLTWDCIDFNAGTIHLYRQLTRCRLPGKKGQYEFISLKNNKSRTFSPAVQVMDILRKIRAKQAEQRLKAGMCWKQNGNFVFTDAVGNHLSDATVYENFKRIVKKLGMNDTRFHDLRHTFATLALQNGADIKTVSMSLGHATTAFTMDVYGHVSDAMMKDCAEKMTNLIANIE